MPSPIFPVCTNPRIWETYATMINRLNFYRLLIILSLTSGVAVRLAPAQEISNATTSLAPPTENPLIISVTPDYSFVERSNVDDQSAHGSSGAQTADLEIETEIPICHNNDWSIPVDFQSANIFLGSVPGIAIPSSINTIHFAAGLAYQFNSAWSVAFTAGPALYRLDEFGSEDIGLAGELRVTYQVNPDLQVWLGADYEMDGKYPALPVAGIKWKPTDHFLLDLRLARFEADYLANDQLSFFIDENSDYEVFRASAHLGNQLGIPSFNNGLGTYEDFHGGAGIRFQFNPALSLSAEAGCSFGRNIEYDRIDHHSIYFDASPYAQLIAKWYF